ncbi:MAG: PfkB family carbohydrate kinase [Elusimicrobia bacterium]|nr:PfkB family carbohydrate kinase [Elusimicrobiota bacterium]
MNALILNLNLSVDKTVLIPAFRPGSIYRVGETLTLPGGKGVNVARALRALGMEVPIAGFASGRNGGWIADSLAKEGFRAFIERHSAGESRVCLTIADSRGLTTDINEEGPAVPAASQRRFLSRFSSLAPRFKAVAVCGRSSAGLEKGFYASLVKRAAEHGCFSIFDTSGPALAEALEAGAEGVKINRHEFEELCRCRFSRRLVHDFFRRNSARGLKTLIVTDGAGTAYAASPFGLWAVVPPPLRSLRSAVGAGDAFMAGFLFGFLSAYGFEKSLRLAAGAAAADCLTLGAGHIDPRKAELYSRRTEVRKVA